MKRQIMISLDDEIYKAGKNLCNELNIVTFSKFLTILIESHTKTPTYPVLMDRLNKIQTQLDQQGFIMEFNLKKKVVQ